VASLYFDISILLAILNPASFFDIATLVAFLLTAQ